MEQPEILHGQREEEDGEDSALGRASLKGEALSKSAAVPLYRARPKGEALPAFAESPCLTATSTELLARDGDGRPDGNEVERCWSLTAWLRSGELPRVLAQLLREGGGSGDAGTELGMVRSLAARLSKDPTAELSKLLLEKNLAGRLADALYPMLVRLRDGKTDGEVIELHSKFALEGGLEFKYDKLSAFFGGLEALIGPPEVQLSLIHI